MIFNKIGLAITFSPNGLELLKSAVRFKNLFNSELFLIHIGERNSKLELQMSNLISQSKLKEDEYQLIWEKGEPAKTIIEITIEHKIDLLVAGALEKENLLKYYMGSVARKIMHQAPCSVLILTNPQRIPQTFKKFAVLVEFTPLCENAIIKSHQFAKLENADEFFLIKEFEVPGLAIAVYDSGSTEETEKNKEQWQIEEENKLKVLLKELNLSGQKIKTKALFGKHGWEARNFVETNRSDLFVISSLPQKINFFDKLFQHDLEFILNRLPCTLLIYRNL
jgi:hypothetical protein